MSEGWRVLRDDKPPCEECRWQQWHRPDFLRTAMKGSVCAHPSALRLNPAGSVWHVSLAREVCKGRRWEKK